MLRLQQQQSPSTTAIPLRNQAKVASLRSFLGIPGEDVGDISQTDYESAAADVERRHQEENEAKALASALPAMISGEYSVKAAGARAQAGEEQQQRQQLFQSKENAINRAAIGERQQRSLDAPVVPVLNPNTGIGEWTTRAGAPGRRTVGSATEREAIQTGQNTLSNIETLIGLGDEIDWKGIGPTGGIKNTMFKFLGVGDPREDDFRVNLQKIRADIMFGSGGKQLTTSEQRVAAGYLADIYTNPQAARSRLSAVQQILERAQARRMGRAPADESDNDWEDVNP